MGGVKTIPACFRILSLHSVIFLKNLENNNTAYPRNTITYLRNNRQCHGLELNLRPASTSTKPLQVLHFT